MAKTQFICTDCIKNLGATLQEGARATSAYVGDCDFCSKQIQVVVEVHNTTAKIA